MTHLSLYGSKTPFDYNKGRPRRIMVVCILNVSDVLQTFSSSSSSFLTLSNKSALLCVDDRGVGVEKVGSCSLGVVTDD